MENENEKKNVCDKISSLSILIRFSGSNNTHSSLLDGILPPDKLDAKL